MLCLDKTLAVIPRSFGPLLMISVEEWIGIWAGNIPRSGTTHFSSLSMALMFKKHPEQVVFNLFIF